MMLGRRQAVCAEAAVASVGCYDDFVANPAMRR